MQLNFGEFSFLCLIALVPLIPAVIRFRNDTAGKVRLFLAVLISLSLFIPLSGVVRFPAFRGDCTVFLVDRSGSALLFQDRFRKEFEQLRDKASSEGGSSDLGLLCFFGDGYSFTGSAQPLSGLSWPGPGFSYPSIEGSSLADALAGGLKLVPDGYRPRIQVIGDGTVSDSELPVPANVEAEYTNASAAVQDCALISFDCPSETPVDSPVVCRLTVFSRTGAQGVIRLHESLSGKIVTASAVTFPEGQSSFDIRVSFSASGYKSLLAEIETEHDAFPENNSLRHYIQVSTTEEPHYLVLGRQITNVPGSRTVTPAELSGFTLESLAPYSAVVLADIPYSEIGRSNAALLSAYVLEAGGGLVAAGTSSLFGPGGYKDTDIERVLPLNSNPRMPEGSRKKVMIAVDTSGSMEEPFPGSTGLKINGAKAAAMGFILEREKEQQTGIGLLFFSAEITVVKTPSDKAGEGILKEKLKKVIPHGGTRILPALRKCADLLVPETEDEDLYIFLITDGITREEISESDSKALLESIAEKDISLFVLNIGAGADSQLISLTEKAGGRYAEMNEGDDITVSFMKEADRELSDLYSGKAEDLVYGPGAAVIGFNGGTGLRSAGHIRTSLQEGALAVVQTAGKEDPLAAVRYTGAGRTAAVCGGVRGESDELFSRLLTWAGRDQGRTGTDVFLSRRGNRLAVEYACTDPVPAGDLVFCSLEGDNGFKEEFSLSRSSENGFRGEKQFDDIPEIIDYRITVRGAVKASGRYTVGYPEEYHPLASSPARFTTGPELVLKKEGTRSFVPFIAVFLGLFLLYELYSVMLARKK